MSVPLPSPLGVSHPMNKGHNPTYVYDPLPFGGRHVNHREIAQQAYDAPEGHAQGVAGASYAIPTTRASGSRMTWDDLKAMIRELGQHARADRKHAYQITRIGGCRTAAYFDERRVAEVFIENDPGNFHLPGAWERLRTPHHRRICIMSPFTALSDVDGRTIELLLGRALSSSIELVAPGSPLQHRPAMDLADTLNIPVRLFSADAPGMQGKPAQIMEGVAWYSDFALIIKPGASHRLSATEQRIAKRMEVFYLAVLENKIGYRGIVSDAGLS